MLVFALTGIMLGYGSSNPVLQEKQALKSVQSIDRILNNINGKLSIILKRNKDKEVLMSREKAPLFKTWLDN